MTAPTDSDLRSILPVGAIIDRPFCHVIPDGYGGFLPYFLQLPPCLYCRDLNRDILMNDPWWVAGMKRRSILSFRADAGNLRPVALRCPEDSSASPQNDTWVAGMQPPRLALPLGEPANNASLRGFTGGQ